MELRTEVNSRLDAVCYINDGVSHLKLESKVDKTVLYDEPGAFCVDECPDLELLVASIDNICVVALNCDSAIIELHLEENVATAVNRIDIGGEEDYSTMMVKSLKIVDDNCVEVRCNNDTEEIVERFRREALSVLDNRVSREVMPRSPSPSTPEESSERDDVSELDKRVSGEVVPQSPSPEAPRESSERDDVSEVDRRESWEIPSQSLSPSTPEESPANKRGDVSVLDKRVFREVLPPRSPSPATPEESPAISVVSRELPPSPFGGDTARLTKALSTRIHSLAQASRSLSKLDSGNLLLAHDEEWLTIDELNRSSKASYQLFSDMKQLDKTESALDTMRRDLENDLRFLDILVNLRADENLEQTERHCKYVVENMYNSSLSTDLSRYANPPFIDLLSLCSGWDRARSIASLLMNAQSPS